MYTHLNTSANNSRDSDYILNGIVNTVTLYRWQTKITNIIIIGDCEDIKDNVWSGEGILNSNPSQGVSNVMKYPRYLSVTC